MYRVKFNGYPLHDLRDERLILRDPRVRLAVGNAGAMSFIIDDDHPYASQITRLKGVLELWNDSMRIFKGRVTKDTRDFYLNREIEVEGLLACLNDSIIPPFNFPEDFEDDAGYQAAAASGNVIKFFLGWLLDQHNAQVGAAQKIQLGTVTVSDPNNYISRASSEYLTTMEVVQKKLEELLGGYLLADYSGDTTVLHYYNDLPLTNVQEVEFGENLLDLVSALDSADTYTAILPIGKEGLTIAALEDGEFAPGIWKSGLILYSQEAEEAIGGRITQVQKWDDVTEVVNLRRKAAALLEGEGIRTVQTITVQAADMGDLKDLPRFVVGRNVRLNSAPHGFSAVYPLMELKPDLLDPGNTWITMGRTTKTATDMSHVSQNATQEKLDQAQQELQDSINGVESSLNKRIDGIEGIDGVYFHIRYSDYSDGRNMTAAPTSTTAYMGTCSTNQETAPTTPSSYTWVRVRGQDGAPGTSQYLHIRYSDDGKTFTGNMVSTNIDDWESGYYTTGKFNQKYTITSSLIPVNPGAKYTFRTIGAWLLGVSQFADSSYVTAATYANSSAERDITLESNVTRIRIYYRSTNTSDTFETFREAFTTGGFAPYMYLYNSERGKTQGAWMGTCASDSETAPTDFDAYTWSKTAGTDGTPGKPGENGKTQYLHIKYSDDGETFTANNGEDLGAWIGTLVDFVEADSTNFNDYTWKKFTEDVDEELENIRQTMTEQYTSVLNTADAIIMEALERYVETSNYEEFRQTVTSQLEMMADEISMKFTTTTEQIEDVGGDLQAKFEQLYKYISFSGETAITIGSSDSAITLEIDNAKGIVFKKNGVSFGRWDGNNFYTGNIVVEVNERAQFGNFAFVPRSDGSLSLLKVGG